MKKGFTLIELLVVVSIISLLSSIVLYGVSEARVEAQDEKKKEEVRQVGLALEINSGNSVPVGDITSSNYGVAYNENSPEYQSAMSDLVSTGSISTVPQSPNGRDYFYLVEDDGTAVFGTILRSNDEISDNGGCKFSNDDYSCDSGSDASNIIDRSLLVEESDSCVDDGICTGVSGGGSGGDTSGGDDGGDVATNESCFTSNFGIITGYDETNCSMDVVIPSTIDGYSVTSIGSAAFQYKPVTSVSIPDSVTSIGSAAFRYSQLTSVSIPNSVTSIGSGAFEFNNITSVSIPNSVWSIGSRAFAFNELTSVSIPDSITSISDNVFYDNQLTSVSIPDSVTSIGDVAFANNQLTSVSIPDSVTYIDNGVFANNQLNSVSIPDSVTSVGSNAFLNNPLNSVSINSSTSYQSNSFGTCTVANGCITER